MPAEAPPGTALVVLNVRAQGGRAAALEPRLADMLRKHHPGVALQAVDGVKAARRAIGALPRGARVVLAGGDGTVHQMLPAILEGGHVMGLVPAGSGDDTARALGLRGLDPLRALSRALTGEPRRIDIGWVSTEHEQRPFLSSLAAGFDAAVAQRALQGPRFLRGLPRYLLATLRELAALQQHMLVLGVDGRTVHEGPALFASTLATPTYGGGMPAAPGAKLDDGQLDLLVAGRFGRPGVLAMLPRLLAGRHLGHPQVALHRFSVLTLHAEAEVPLAADGEAMAPSRRATVRVGRALLPVVAARG